MLKLSVKPGEYVLIGNEVKHYRYRELSSNLKLYKIHPNAVQIVSIQLISMKKSI